MKKSILLLTVLIITVPAPAQQLVQVQKKPLDHSVYDAWKTVGALSLSEDGKYASYLVQEQEGDRYAEVLNLVTLQKQRIERASQPKLTPDGRFLIATINPFFKETKEAKLKKVKKDEMPKDTLGIYNCVTGELKKIPFLKSVKIGKWGKTHIAFQCDMPADTTGGKKHDKKEKDQGENLMVYQLASGFTDTLAAVSDYNFSTGGDTLFFVRRPHSKDSLLEAGLFMYTPKDRQLTNIYTIDLKQKVDLPVVSEDNRHLVFYANLDTTQQGKNDVSILYYNQDHDKAKILIDNNLKGLAQDWKISKNRALIFSKSGHRLFFGIAPVLPEKDTTIVPSEVAQLDIWHYKDNYIQPQQLQNLNRELKKSYMCVMDLAEQNNPTTAQHPEELRYSTVQPGNTEHQHSADHRHSHSWRRLSADEYHIVQVPQEYDASWGYSVSNYPYQMETSWNSNRRSDLYLINITDGSASLLLKNAYISGVSASKEGKYLVWFNNLDQNWYSYDVQSRQIVCMTEGLDVSFANELHDTPNMASSYGNAGWMEGDQAIFINDRYDIWQLDPLGKTPPINFTDGLGRKENLTFDIVRLNEMLLPAGTPGVKKDPIKPKETVYFSVFDHTTKETGYYYKQLGKKRPAMTRWIQEPMTFVYLTRSKDGKVMIYSKHNFENSPNIWFTKDNFKTQVKITDINPQQKEYNWGTAELVHWKSATGIDLDGILYKPENFDPTKKYPMIVYFYERTSHTIHSYRAPAPSRSTINIPFFVSNEYIVFVPDIAYQTGHPGKSALDCIVPGVKKLIAENSWIDADNIAIQGQSWGGYQVAYMVTQPQVFKWKAAGAGAPVSNMTSAYGGIRWGSGMVRQFQYEHTQSRIGQNLWDGFDLYIENSPLFFADKVETPLLIMHNDKDEAVPWYQGIELFTALRRLEKPVWMLQYNNESRNLSKRVNAKDLSIRLEQFFNHFLKSAPMPVWMKTGVPATFKGIDWGLDLTTQ
jgi:dipeptidyl aminopeptidase/acylaminoacyl peptidase